MSRRSATWAVVAIVALLVLYFFNRKPSTPAAPASSAGAPGGTAGITTGPTLSEGGPILLPMDATTGLPTFTTGQLLPNQLMGLAVMTSGAPTCSGGATPAVDDTGVVWCVLGVALDPNSVQGSF